MPVSPVTITIESPISPGPAQVSDVETEVFLWPAEVENRLLDPGVVNDTQTQALLLTTLVRKNPGSLGNRDLFIFKNRVFCLILVNTGSTYQRRLAREVLI
jgi:hypothetical protein